MPTVHKYYSYCYDIIQEKCSQMSCLFLRTSLLLISFIEQVRRGTTDSVRVGDLIRMQSNIIDEMKFM